MSQWETVAQGTSLENLTAVVGDMELSKGTRMKVVMDLKLPVGGMFNWAVADWLSQRFIPDGMEFVDAYGSGNEGVVEMESDPAWLLAVILFIKAHWLALVIAGFTLWLIITLITISIKVPKAVQIPFWLLAGAAMGVVGVVILSQKTSIKGGRSP